MPNSLFVDFTDWGPHTTSVREFSVKAGGFILGIGEISRAEVTADNQTMKHLQAIRLCLLGLEIMINDFEPQRQA